MAKMPLAEHDNVVKTFPADRTDRPFTISVLSRRSRRGWPIPNAHRPKAADEDVTVDGVAVTNAKEALMELRAISAGLFLPDIGDTGDAEKVVQSIVCAHEGRTNCKVAYRTENVPKRLSRDIVRCVARVVQEALNNSYRHSSAMEQSVCLSGDNSVVHLSIGDAGRGMSADKPANRGHLAGLGIPGMASRVEALGGTFAYGF